jgi:hypothetical protein
VQKRTGLFQSENRDCVHRAAARGGDEKAEGGVDSAAVDRARIETGSQEMTQGKDGRGERWSYLQGAATTTASSRLHVHL